MKFLKSKLGLCLISFIVGGLLVYFIQPEIKISKREVSELKESNKELSLKLKNLNKKYKTEIASLSKTYKSQLEDKEEQIITLESRVKTLSKRMSKTSIKIVKPDGTIEEKETFKSFEQSKDEYRKYAQKLMKLEKELLEEKLTAHYEKKEERIKSIFKESLLRERNTWAKKVSKLEKEINSKKLTIYGGSRHSIDNLSEFSYYIGGQYNFLGPLSLDFNVDRDSKVGLGLGISF